jgi:uncharacterized damage-inducible protein DinB
MERIKWNDRMFDLNLDVGLYQVIAERLRGTACRLFEMAESLSELEAEQSYNSNWSIKEHITHLLNIESLHDGRVDDFINKCPQLRPVKTDAANTETEQNNKMDLKGLIESFKQSRVNLIEKLETLNLETHHFYSLHPRLQINMRPIDLMFFIAEHDDHHLTSIREVLINLNFIKHEME